LHIQNAVNGGVFSPEMAPEALMERDRPRLLVIEDDPDVRLFMAIALQREGYDVRTAADAREAKKYLSSESYDLVLTDFGLPGIDGLSFIREAKRQGLLGSAKIMVLTAFPSLAVDVNVPVLSKPIDFDDLTERLRQMLESDPQRPHASTRAQP
jgi:DNA-binding response OmpR family regulator